jgi:hypothetical protein
VKSQSLALIELPASSSMERATDDMEKRLMRSNTMKLEAFTVRLAWAFAAAVFLLLLVSLLLVVSGYAGSTFDLQPKTVSSSRGR